MKQAFLFGMFLICFAIGCEQFRPVTDPVTGVPGPSNAEKTLESTSEILDVVGQTMPPGPWTPVLLLTNALAVLGVKVLKRQRDQSQEAVRELVESVDNAIEAVGEVNAGVVKKALSEKQSRATELAVAKVKKL